MREAEAEPADPTVAVVCGISLTSSVPELGARDLEDHADDALPDLGGGAVNVGAAVWHASTTRAAQ